MTDLPEAPVSINTNVKSKGGFEYQLTIRGSSYTELLKNLDELEKQFGTFGLTPMPKYSSKFGGQKKEFEYVEGKVCPKCGGKLVKKVSSVGKPFHKCENGKWDFTTKQATGCDFVDWLNMPVTYDKQNPYAGGNSVPVNEYENYQG
jgi:hypothetical protein